MAGLGGGPKYYSKRIEAWALDALRNDPRLDLVIAGHSHLPAKVEVESDRYYLNSGDWISHSTYLAIPPRGSPPAIWRWGFNGSMVLDE
jgi:hypothetical protein